MHLDNVYVVNLDSDRQSWTRTFNLLKKEGFNPTRVSAINAKQMTDDFVKEKSTPHCRNFCTGKMIAIAASHVKAWETVVRNNDSYALIVEDDLITLPDFKETIRKLNVDNDIDIMYLGCLGCQPDPRSDMFSFASYYVHGKWKVDGPGVKNGAFAPDLALGTHCYIVSNKGARKLLENIDGKINEHVDVQMNKLIASGTLKASVAWPLVAYQTSTMAEVKGFPRVFNGAVEELTCSPGVSMGYCMSVPIITLGSLEISGWTILLWFISGILSLLGWDLKSILALFTIVLAVDISTHLESVVILFFIMSVIHYFISPNNAT